MYDVSNQFLLQTNRSGRRSITADFYYNGGLILEDAPIAAGDLTYDRRSLVRASGRLQLAHEGIDWQSIEPWGTEIEIKCGVLLSHGELETVPMGKFRIEDNRFRDGVSAAPMVRFFDRAKLLEEAAGLDQDYSGFMASDAVEDILGFGIPNWDGQYEFDIDDYRLPGGTVVSSSLLETLNEIAQHEGGEIWFDRDGVFHMEVIEPITVDTTIGDAVYDISAGINLISAERVLTRIGAYNAIYVTGTTTGDGAPVRGFATDNNPGSLSAYGGAFGRRIQRLNVSGLTTQLAAQNAATELLKKRAGLVQNTTFEALLNPALDPGDIITLFYFDNTVEIHQVNSIDLDLNAWTMRVGTSSVQLVG